MGNTRYQMRNHQQVNIPQVVLAAVAFLGACLLPMIRIGVPAELLGPLGRLLPLQYSAGALAVGTSQWYMLVLLFAALLIPFSFYPLKRYSLLAGGLFLFVLLLFGLLSNAILSHTLSGVLMGMAGDLLNQLTGYSMNVLVYTPDWGFYVLLIMTAAYMCMPIFQRAPKAGSYVPPWAQGSGGDKPVQPWDAKR